MFVLRFSTYFFQDVEGTIILYLIVKEENKYRY